MSHVSEVPPTLAEIDQRIEASIAAEHQLMIDVMGEVLADLKHDPEMRGPPGPSGPRGEEGLPGKLPLVKLWMPETVYYEGDVVANDGGTFQAMCDTGQPLLFLADSKTGRKTVILNAPALAVLAGLDRLGPYVVPGDDPDQPRADLKRPWGASIDIALHYGDAAYGNIGSGNRLDFTAVGRDVNILSRLELLCKDVGRPLLMTDTFAVEVADQSLRSAISSCAASAGIRLCTPYAKRGSSPAVPNRPSCAPDATLVLSENHIRAYWWCSPDKIGMATMTPDRWTARPRGASLPNAKCVRA
jgi:hypothetical protein